MQQGVTAASPLSKVYDVSGTIGGPIAKDRLWYFVTAHRGGSTTDSTNVYYNLNAGDPAKWSYVPDCEPESVLGPPLRERQRSCHVADDPAPEGQRLLG